MPFARRLLVALVAALALLAALLLPGPFAFAIGLGVFFAAPFALRPRPGKTARRGDDEHLHGVRTFGGSVEASVATVGLLSALAYAWGSLEGRASGLTVFAWLPLVGCIPFTLVGVLSGLRDRAVGLETVVLERDTLTLHGRQGTKVVAYGEVESVTVQDTYGGSAITIATATERHLFHTPQPVAEEQAEAIRARVHAARRPALGEGPPELRKPFGMGVREWLGRVDGLVANARGAGAYRGGAQIDEDVLLRVLTSETEDRYTRAGAARALVAAGGEAARARVAEYVKGVDDPDLQMRLSVATITDAEDVEHAFEHLDFEEIERSGR